MKNILKYVILVLLIGALAVIVYIFIIKDNTKLELPIYEVKYSETGQTDITNNIGDLNNNNYKLVNKVKCKYDACHWYDYNVSKSREAKWIYYDNNDANEGGYYIFDQKTNKVISGPYKEIRVDIDTLVSDNILHGVYLYSYGNKVGYFDLRGLNRMLFEVKYDEINASPNHTFYVTREDKNLTLYSFLSNKLNEINTGIEEYTFVEGDKTEYVVIKKDGKYNFVYEGYDIEILQTKDNYDFLNVLGVKEQNNLYFVYTKDDGTYISRTDISKLRREKSLTIDPEFNHKVSAKVEQWFITSDGNNVLYVNPNYQSNEYYVINTNENKIEKKQH